MRDPRLRTLTAFRPKLGHKAPFNLWWIASHTGLPHAPLARLVFLVGLAPHLTACQSPTAQAVAPIQAVAKQPAVPPLPPGPERDAAWMKLAPKAPLDPALARTTVDFATREPVGTIVVDAAERRLYLVQPGGKAMRYPVSVGRAGLEWSGRAEIDCKLEWPDWNPAPEMIGRHPDLPPRLEGGPFSPIGARALYLA